MKEENKIVETKKRAIAKTISWRVIATLNSFWILSIGWNGNFKNAIIMNITGMVFMYYFERIWSKINYGRYTEDTP
ncbi:MAG: putative rane protein [Bacteroidota bacterium]|jgi:uncharacterized membrane protein